MIALAALFKAACISFIQSQRVTNGPLTCCQKNSVLQTSAIRFSSIGVINDTDSTKKYVTTIMECHDSSTSRQEAFSTNLVENCQSTAHCSTLS